MGIDGFVVLVIEADRISVHGNNASLFDDALCDIEVDRQHFLSLAPTAAIVDVAIDIDIAIAAPSTCPGSRQFHVSMRSVNVSTISILICSDL